MKKGFYQVSDKVPSKVVTTATKTCDRDDCCLSARVGETTLMATVNYYNKDGLMQIEDNNRFTADLCCRKCWLWWVVDNNGNVLKSGNLKDEN